MIIQRDCIKLNLMIVYCLHTVLTKRYFHTFLSIQYQCNLATVGFDVSETRFSLICNVTCQANTDATENKR